MIIKVSVAVVTMCFQGPLNHCILFLRLMYYIYSHADVTTKVVISLFWVQFIGRLFLSLPGS